MQVNDKTCTKRGIILFASFPSTMKILPIVPQAWIYKDGTVCFGETVGPGNLFNLGSELPENIMVCNSGVMAFTSADWQTVTKDPIV